MNVVEIARSAAWTPTLLVLGRLLADRANLFDRDHCGAIDVNVEVVDGPQLLISAVLVLANLDRKDTLLAWTRKCGIPTHCFDFAVQHLFLARFDQLECGDIPA